MFGITFIKFCAKKNSYQMIAIKVLRLIYERYSPVLRRGAKVTFFFNTTKKT